MQFLATIAGIRSEPFLIGCQMDPDSLCPARQGQTDHLQAQASKAGMSMTVGHAWLYRCNMGAAPSQAHTRGTTKNTMNMSASKSKCRKIDDAPVGAVSAKARGTMGNMRVIWARAQYRAL